MRDVQLDRAGIRLGQFLKLAGMIDSGADAKTLLAQGSVTVNDAPEARRGRQLEVGDVVRLGDDVARVA